MSVSTPVVICFAMLQQFSKLDSKSFKILKIPPNVLFWCSCIHSYFVLIYWQFAARVPAIPVPMLGCRDDICADDTGIGKLAHHCGAGRDPHAGPLPISGAMAVASASTAAATIIPAVWGPRHPPSCTLNCSEACACMLGLCMPALPEPFAHTYALPPVVCPLLTCVLRCPTELHLPNTDSKIRLLRLSRQQ